MTKRRASTKGKHAQKAEQKSQASKQKKDRKKSWIKVGAHACKIVPLPHCFTKCTLGDPTGGNKLLKRKENMKKMLGPTFDYIVFFLCVCVGDVDCI